ncbi:uncharacterized protein LOC114519047 [Dendronephthya gigantea]|uniref:uncharacterized protein LOC114519047 n=1 Tax=Dendronephthya gigantea TaxID=151771 RepID=UPI00106B2693|nr:uncharacterized protein LOC114519047 [Dendronephthya gigantea]
MKEVAELDNIDGVECLVICVEGGNIYHASTKLGQKFLEEYPDTCTKFGNVIQNVSLNNKIDVSDKMIRTIFNKKYSTLVGKASPLPYSAAESLGLKFNGLPSELIDELGCYPKQPNHYGAQQKRRLWERRNSFSFSLQSHMEIINTASNNASSSSTSSNVSSSTSTDPLLPPSTLPPMTASDHQVPLSTSLRPSTSRESISTPSQSQPQDHSSLAPMNQPDMQLPSQSLSKNDGQELIVSRIIEQTIFLNASNGLSLQLKEGTVFGLMDERNMIKGTGKVMAKHQLHGRPIAPGCLVVEVVSVKDSCVTKPPVPGAFDDDEAVHIGGFYLWPISKLSFLGKTGIQVGINK